MPLTSRSLVGIFLLLFLYIVPATAELVYNAPPARSKTSIRAKKQRPPKARKRIQSQQKDITLGLYLTFALLLLLPLLVLGGFGLVLLGYAVAWLAGLGIGLILLGNLAAIMGGILTGQTTAYSTSALKTAVWLFFFINALGGVFLLLTVVNVVIGQLLLWIVGIGALVVALGFLIWGIFMWQQNKGFRQGSKLPAEE